MTAFFMGIYDFFSTILGGLICLFFGPMFIIMYFVAFWFMHEKCIKFMNQYNIRLSQNNSLHKFLAYTLYYGLFIGWIGLALYLLKFDYNPLHLAMDILPGARCN